MRVHGWDSFWPIQEVWEQLDDWINVNQIADTYTTALNSEVINPIRKLQSVQTIAYRLYN